MQTNGQATITKNDDDEIVVSVLTPCYNHGKYIRKCIESIVNQKTNFKFELLIHDDASTDDSAKIIREYEEKYPDIVKPVYQTENQYSKGVKITPTYLVPRAKGKYFAFCEGDDYWTDENKLQKQVDALESHPDCYLCTHYVQKVTEECKPIKGVYHPQIEKLPTGVIESDNFLDCIIKYYFHTSSYLLVGEKYRKLWSDSPEYCKQCDIGDMLILMSFGVYGNVFFIGDFMSERRVSPNGWAKSHESLGKGVEHIDGQIKVFNLFNEYYNFKYNDFVRKKIATILFYKSVLIKDKKYFYGKENRELYKQLSLKEKIRYRLYFNFPLLYKALKGIKDKIRKR